jgi:NADPH:quinone reductase-like Zn-dependent oxidoreductase
VEGFKVGDRVFGVNWGVGRHNGIDIPVVGGGFAEYSLVNASKLSHIPNEVSDEQAAAVALAGTTAYQCLFEQLAVQKDQKLLILGGSTAVGQIAIQLAKSAGVKVYTTCSSRSHAFVRQFDPEVIIDYTTSAWEEHPSLRNIDAVFDTVGASGSFSKAKLVLKPNGKFLAITGGEVSTDVKAHPPLEYAGAYVLRNDPKHQDILVKMIVDGRLKVIVDEKFPFTKDGVAGIFQKVASGKSLGKNVLMVLK